MKIGILTLYHESCNFGGALQAYALQKVMSRYGKCEQIDFDFEHADRVYDIKEIAEINADRTNKDLAYYAKRVIPKTIEMFDKSLERNTFLTDHVMKKTVSRRKRFEEFREGIPHSAACGQDTVASICEAYDLIIAGSDQIWANWLYDSAVDIFSLGMIQGKRTGVYAASLSSAAISPAHRYILEKNLAKIDFLSVREKRAKQQIAPFIGEKKCEVVLDPTLLLETEEWDEVEAPIEATDPYMLCYFLGRNLCHRTFAYKLAQRRGLKTVVFPYIKGNKFSLYDHRAGDIKDLTSGPREFISLIKNAALVLTDSFHAIVFSSLYHKNFFAFLRDKDDDKDSMNDRVRDFLEDRGLESRLLDPRTVKMDEVGGDVDHKRSDRVLKTQKERSLRFINDMVSKRR